MPIGCIISVVFCFVVSVPPLEMVSPSLVRIGLIGIEPASIPVDSVPLGDKVVVGEPLGADGNGKSFGLTPFKIARNHFAVSFRVTPLEGIGCGLSDEVEVVGNIPFLWSRDQTWCIKVGTSEVPASVALDPFNVSINSVNSKLVVVAVPGTKGNELSWGNHWSVSWVLVLLVAGL